jgi:hypothetical protein
MSEWTPSLRMPTEPVTRPAPTLSTIRQELEAIETAAARDFTGGAFVVTGVIMPSCGW